MKKDIELLLVDDDADDIDFFQIASRKLNPTFNITTAADGVEALEILSDRNGYRPHVIFLDLNMPKMGGRQFLDIVNSKELIPGVPIIVYSTSNQRSDIEYMLKNGAVCFITKADNVQRLLLILTKVAEGLHTDLAASLKSITELTNHITCNSPAMRF